MNSCSLAKRISNSLGFSDCEEINLYDELSQIGNGCVKAAFQMLCDKIEEMENFSMKFDYEEIELLYTACMSYHDKLLEVKKELPNDFAFNYALSNKASKMLDLAVSFTDRMAGVE